MSMSSLSPSASAKTELETVVNWPMLVTAAGVGFLFLAVPIALGCIAALKGTAAKNEDAARRTPPPLEPVNVAPIAPPLRPLASHAIPEEAATPLPVYVEASRPPIEAVPTKTIPAVVPAPAPNPVLQFTETNVPLFKRFDPLGEDDLLRELSGHAREVDLESVKGTRAKLLPKKAETGPAQARATRRANVREVVFTPVDTKSLSAFLALQAERPDLKGLPMLGAADCQAPAETVKKRQAISQELRRFLRSRSPNFSLGSPSQRLSSGHSHAPSLGDLLAEHGNWFLSDGLSTVVQMLETEEPQARSQLVERLATVKSAATSTTLARLALFDVARNIREQAATALKDRPREDYRQVLLDGLRYPWPPVAAHAAETLVALDDAAAVFPLTALLDEPDPRAPLRDKNNKWVVREVVRINHLRNCLLCHPPSTATTDPLRGVVPTPGRPLPRIYYSSQRGDFVRADVTYLRQDFSLVERVAKPDKWPEWQRFDYVVRTRELTADELAVRARKPHPPEPASYPQRNAVLFALRELTGWDAGTDSWDWYELVYTTEAAAER